MIPKKRVFRANSINEAVAYACVCAINNKHGQELVRVENELFQLRRKLTNVNAAMDDRLKNDCELSGKRVQFCYSCERLKQEAQGEACRQCADWTCIDCLSECDECHKDFCDDCLRQCEKCRDMLTYYWDLVMCQIEIPNLWHLKPSKHVFNAAHQIHSIFVVIAKMWRIVDKTARINIGAITNMIVR